MSKPEFKKNRVPRFYDYVVIHRLLLLQSATISGRASRPIGFGSVLVHCEYIAATPDARQALRTILDAAVILAKL